VLLGMCSSQAESQKLRSLGDLAHPVRMQVFLIGGAGRVGSALACRLVAAGNHVVLAGRTETSLAALSADLSMPYAVVDASGFEALDQVLQKHPPLDAVVNCADSLLLKPAHLNAENEYREIVDINLTTAFATVRAGAETKMSTGGSIVPCASAAARTGLANHEAIAAAKSGVVGLTLSAAATYAPRNIRVNCVAPGLVASPLTARITENEIARKASQSMHALGRIGTPDDIAAALAWLVDPANSWITGQVVGVDGGLGTIRPR